MAIKKTNQAEELESGLRGAERLVGDAEKIRALSDETLEWVAGGEMPPSSDGPTNITSNPLTKAFR